MTTVAAAAPIAKMRAGFDLTMPVLLLFAAVLCLLIVMPLGWLVGLSPSPTRPAPSRSRTSRAW